MNSDLSINALRGELIREGETDPNGGGWSDPVIQCLQPGHRNLQETLEIIESATTATPRQRSLARQALGLGGGTSISPETGIGEGELFEAMARGL